MKKLELTKRQKEVLISTLKCTQNRMDEYGSFGNSDTDYDYMIVEKILNKLKGKKL